MSPSAAAPVPGARLALLFLLGCAPSKVLVLPTDDSATDDPATDPTAAVYDLDHLLQVDLETAEEDWDTLRAQTRTLADTLMAEDCQEVPFRSPFTWFEAAVSIDGQRFEQIDLRKKGFLGSMSEDKPALKLDLVEHDPDASFSGVERLTLNNAVSDPALVRQCLAFGFFADAGVAAPRCSLARVSVNGEDLGIYVNVEPVRDELLERHFGSAAGNLYEGTLADFRPGWTATLEKKNNEEQTDRSDIDALVAAAAVEDDALMDALDGVLDLDAFFTFWAAEVLIGHGDGYTGNTNNFYVYADPADGRFHFLPWGVDEVLYTAAEGEDQEEPEILSVYASGVLANRLYGIPEGRERYLERVGGLLDGAWDPAVFTDRSDRMAALIEPALSRPGWRDVEAAIEDLHEGLEQRGEVIAEQVAAGGVEWPGELRESYCFVPWGSADAEFSTTWGSLYTDDWFGTGASTLNLDLDEVFWQVEGGALAGESEGAAYVYLPAYVSDTEAVLLFFAFDPDRVAPGEVEMDLIESYGAVLYADFSRSEEFEYVAYVMGTLTLEEAGTGEGDPVTGSFEGQFLSF